MINNYPCTYNPNTGYANDCTGKTVISQTITGNTGTNNNCSDNPNGYVCTTDNNMVCTYDKTKNPPMECRDKYCYYYFSGSPDLFVNSTWNSTFNRSDYSLSPNFNPPDSQLPNSNINNPKTTKPDKTKCTLNGKFCESNNKQNPPLQCTDPGSCIYGYNNGNLIYDLTFNPPFKPNPDSKACPQYTPSNYMPTYSAFTRVPGPSSSKSKPPSSTPVIAPSISNSFSFYKWALPITIPSTWSPKDTIAGNFADPAVANFWIQSPYVPTEGYSDIYPPNQGVTAWDGFNKALSKCIELDGSQYPKENNVCSDSNIYSSTNKCIDPKVAYPNYKPKCYAVVTQSDDVASSRKTYHSINYTLVEEPNSSTRTNLSAYNEDPNMPGGTGWVQKKQIDKNYLFCESLFYTWIKNTPSGAPYNPPCTPVVCPTVSTPSDSPCVPVTCPVGSWNNNYSVNSCPAPNYNYNAPPPPPPNPNDDPLPPSFWNAKIPKPKPVFRAPPSSSSSYTTYYIIGGSVLVLILVLWYLFKSPNVPIIPKNFKKAITSVSKKAGYFFVGE